MNSETEIRNISTGSMFELVEILEVSNDWKKLMEIIPRDLENENSPLRYTSEHVSTLLRHRKKTGKDAAAIFLEEWGIVGRNRPKIKHLLKYLIKAQLFRAADFVAVTILHEDVPKRPDIGPAAKIIIDDRFTTSEREMIEKHFDNVSYHSSLLQTDRSSDNLNRNIVNQHTVSIPKIIVNSVSEDDLSNINNSSIYFESSPPSNLIQFSTNDTGIESSVNVPKISILLNGESNCLPDFSDLIQTESTVSDQSDLNLPNMSELLNNNSESFAGPHLSQLLGHNTESSLESENDLNSEPTIPQISALLNSVPNIVEPSSSSSDNNESLPVSSLFRNSPLPTLELNTELPHFNYADLEQCTNSFNESLLTSGGLEARKLGEGAFGTVFLGIGLMNRRVAVKKLHLDGGVVSEDDSVTRQFRNEVELLYRYRHENLLALLGYSMDGPTYCLIYEYVPGGILGDRITSENPVLAWIPRLRIAHGVAKAIAYLHSAYETPLIHRDIKSANILLDDQLIPKLSDFGLVRLSPNLNTSAATTVFGTSAYMAPEAFRGDVSIKIDTFSFGVVVLELLTGLPPLDENREGNDLVTHVEDVIGDKGIEALLDYRAGVWIQYDINYSKQLYFIAKLCLEEKKKRPTMVDVCNQIGLLLENLGGDD